MQESAAGQRRRWADIVVILVGLSLVGLAAWNAPVSAGAGPDEARSMTSIYMAYAVGGGSHSPPCSLCTAGEESGGYCS